MLGVAASPTTGSQSGETQALGQRHVVILNWRDITNPRAGGAERVTHEIARHWVDWGHQVTLFCASYHGALPEETIDGVRVIRRGHQHTVHWEAYRYYRAHFRGQCDAIIDEVNTIPFFAPLYAHEPVVMYSNQLAREVWRYEAPFPLSAAGYVAEPLYLQAYRRTPIITISTSTQDSLRRIGLRGPCHVIPMAVDTRPPKALPSLDSKEPVLTLAFTGRVVPSKRVDHIIRALALIHRSGCAGTDGARLWIIGSCDEAYRRMLNRLIVAHALDKYVTFWGHVDDETKSQLLAQAHTFVMTSVREGWGLVVTEANLLGTPAVVYDVPGLRDSTRDGETGLVCRPNTPATLARAIVSLHADPVLYSRLREQAWIVARDLNWQRTARAAWEAVKAVLSP
jgi:glycosyltransferase involved in cell wall biosynthesis